MANTILYIEDNAENRLLVRRVLEVEGFTVVEADSGMAGLKKAETTRLDLILMDINLPEIDGYELTHRLKQMPHLARVPIVAMTANVMKATAKRRWLRVATATSKSRLTWISYRCKSLASYRQRKHESITNSPKQRYQAAVWRSLASRRLRARGRG